MVNFFKVKESGSTVRTEIVAGLTTFMAMVYILMVNAGMFSNPFGDGTNVLGVSYGAMYIATALGAIVGTLLMAFFAKMPLAQASGMGVNAFVVYTLVVGYGLTYANAMVFTLLDGVIFILLTATGLRKKIFEGIPTGVRLAIPVGIGLFIAFIGFQNAGVIVNNDSTLVTYASFNLLNPNNTFGSMLPAFIALAGVIAIAVLTKLKVKGAVLWGVLGSAALYYAMAGIGAALNDEACKAIFAGISFSNPFNAFGEWATQSAGKVFTQGFNFSGYLANHSVADLVLVLITSALSLCMIDMFDTIGTLYGACSKGNLLDENGTPIRMEKMMMADAIATCAGAMCGTSTVTTFVESSAGVMAGGKTGLSALVTAIGFAVAMFLSPIAQLIPGAATAAALIWVGVLMMSSAKDIHWDDPVHAVVAFTTFIFMVLGYSISHGIGMGILAYILIRLFTGRIKEVKLPTYVIGVLFLATFLLTD